MTSKRTPAMRCLCIAMARIMYDDTNEDHEDRAGVNPNV